MKLKLAYSRPDGSIADLAVTVDADCAVGDLADRLATSDPTGARAAGGTLAYASQSGPVTLDRRVPVVGSGLQSGTAIALAAAPAGADASATGVAAILTVHSGPDSGQTFELTAGPTTIGRGRQSGVQLSDPMVSTLHARVIVGDHIEIVDENSSNGILMGGQQVSRVLVAPDDQILIGEDLISISPRGGASLSGTPTGPSSASVEFNRSPRVDPVYEGPELVAPDPPTPPRPQRFPTMALLMPILMAGVLLAVMKSWTIIVFVAFSPLMMLGAWWETRRSNAAEHADAILTFRANLSDLVARGHSSQDDERARRMIEHPGTAEVAAAIGARSSLLWTRRPEHRSFMELRLGLGAQSSRVSFDRTASRDAVPELVHELDAVLDRFVTVDRVPIVGSFDRSGSLGVSGPRDVALAVAAGLMTQLVGLHSPAEVVLCAVSSSQSAEGWQWLKWLPHTTSNHSPLTSQPLASTPPACSNLVAELADLIDERSSAEDDAASDDGVPLPRVVVVVEDDAPIERNRLVQIAESGPAVGVHVLWRADRVERIPSACRAFVEIDARDGSATTGRVVEGELLRPVLVEPVNLSDVTSLARSLSPVVDAGARPNDQSDLPSVVSFLAEAGFDLAESAHALLERWSETRSVFPPEQFPDDAPRPRMKRPGGLRALVGRGGGDNTYLDLRAQGPHALVGGTTGAGKSEFLQSWIMGMATAYSPQRITFLFIDYKGGAAFADCVRLPHCVGLVTDLSPLLVRRALTSLRAELRYREHLLNRHRAKDLLELEASGNPSTPPSLVIVVDEFAALVSDVPDFVDGVVDVAQRGRSLGLHLILATQRPAGVIKDNLRANTNLRVALRMADEDDSTDVIGSKVAAGFDPAIPGRAIVKSGPGRLEPFQSGYVGGWSSSQPPPPSIHVEPLGFGAELAWEVAEVSDSAVEVSGPTDIARLTDRIIEAAELVQLPAPRAPWLPELDPVYDLSLLQLPRRDDALGFGVLDDPDAQEQRVVAFHPDVDGNLAVFGTGGSGKSTFLRTVAISAGLTKRGGPCVVYGLDFGSRGLAMLEPLPHVGSVVNAEDAERTARLLDQLRDTIDERAVRYAAVNAGSIGDYRRIADAPQEPRVLLLLDGFAAFRSAYESGFSTKVFDALSSIATDGRPVGVHLVISADRLGAIPTGLLGAIQKRVALRLGNEMDESMLGVPRDGFLGESPPGRGFIDGDEVQVAVLSGSALVSAQAAAIVKLGETMRRAGVMAAPEIRRLPDRVQLAGLPALVDGLPTFALADDTLGGVAFDPIGAFLVAGPPRSGRTTTVETLVASLRRTRSSLKVAYFGQRRSPLATAAWDHRAVGPQEAAKLAQELVDERGASWPDAESWLVLLDGVGEFLGSDADYPLQDLLRACRSQGVFVVAEGETSDLGSSYPLLQAIKASRSGVVLQPDQGDGDTLFRTSFPRVSRAEFCEGRGMFVHAGRVRRVQVAQVDPTR
jgi:S-DNA-T family DNA segregation ATPase FtsK/SpoIIIE